MARATWFINIAELNPEGRDLFTSFLPWLLDAYRFKVYPKPSDDFSHGMKLMRGELVKQDGRTLAIDLTIYSDSIAADSYSSTADAEEFLEKSMLQLPKLGLAYTEDMVRRKTYNSQLNVRCDKPFQHINPKLANFSKSLSAAIGETPFDLAAIEFWPNQTQVFKPVSFSFQKKTGEPASSDRYWSQAPLPTHKHLKILEEFEALL